MKNMEGRQNTDPHTMVEILKQQFQQGGNYDEEGDLFKKILNDLRAGTITEEDAQKRILAVEENRIQR